jgi:hemerythrin-like domain-containing protein
MEADHPLIARVLTDHVRIRHLADRLGSTANPPLQALHELGERLERHVRLEERELFPLIERSASEADLRRLVTDMSR